MQSSIGCLPLRSSAIVRSDLQSGVPQVSRPYIRFRKESFGYLAAFPEGRVGMFRDRVSPRLEAGGSYSECEPDLIDELRIETDFHFSAPLMAWLEITRECNLRCRHCFTEGGVRRAGELSTEQILALLGEWSDMGVFSVVITGGEPTVHRDFCAIVSEAHRLGFVVGIATNGINLAPRLLESLPTRDVLISVSLDGLHGASGVAFETEFAHVAERIRLVQDHGFPASIMSTATRENIDELEGVVQWAAAHGVSFRSVPFVPMGRGALHTTLSSTCAEVETAARFWIAEQEWERRRDQELGLCAGKVFNYLVTTAFAARRCMSGRGICYVTSNGDVYPCTTCSGGKILGAGNVQHSSFRDIWNGHWDIRNITWNTFSDACRACPLNAPHYYCSGRCPGSSYVLNHTLHECGLSPFQKGILQAREELFRDRILAQPRVPVRLRSSDSERVR